MKKRIAVLLLAIVLAVSSSTTATATNSLFTDMAEDHWAYQYVSDLYRQGVISGYPSGVFMPEKNVTYGEVFKLILRAIGVPNPAPQAGKHWAYPYIQLAFNNYLVYSFNANNLDNVPTRLEVARMVGRALDYTDVSGATPYNDCTDGFVVKLYEKGVMDGFLNEDGSRSFHPDKPITRAEISTIIWRMKNLDLTAGMFRSGEAIPYWVDVLTELPGNPYSASQFVKDSRGRMTYTGGYYAQGIDVARFQGDINWNAVAADGIDFAIIRAGARGYGTAGTLLNDLNFDKNMKGAIAAGLDIGAYYFSNAITVAEAIEEANVLIQKLEPYRDHITYPVVCDWEYIGGSQSRAYGVDSEIITQCIAAFCQRIQEAGYTPMLYFNAFCGYVKMDLRDLTQYHFWYAQYSNAPTFLYNFQFWQYSCTGRVAGISGDVDMDLCFIPFGKGAVSQTSLDNEEPEEPDETETPETPETPDEPVLPDVPDTGDPAITPDPIETVDPNADPAVTGNDAAADTDASDDVDVPEDIE